ncbi:MAG: lipocalin family protein [Chitinophagaceae bacterium]|nr:lipocalin family protein [Chitinophagaceae bacterium]
MKRIKIFNSILLLFTIVFFAGCSASKEARTMKGTINGTWTLQTITIEGNNSIINTKVFNEADNSCFIGSSWNFIANNSKGSYTLPSGAGGCVATTRNIRWSIYEPEGEEKRFQFKRLDDKNNPMDDNNGYRLSIAQLNDTNMQLKSAISFEGNPVNIVYNFVKK